MNGRSENDRPDVFGSEQLYVAFVFSHGGSDLESWKSSSLLDSLSILFQVVGALAVAEELYQFEHRDLHWGNILIAAEPQHGEVMYGWLGAELRSS